MSEVDKLIQSTAAAKSADALQGDLGDVAAKAFEGEFKDNFQSLKEDIEHIDIRMQHINKFIVNLETQVNNIRALIANDENPAKRGSYYTLMNTCIELNARYEELYLKCMDIKYKYRKEQDDLNHKVKKLSHLDIPKMRGGGDDPNAELSASKLAKILFTLSEKLDKTDTETNKVFNTIQDLEDDPDLRIG